LDFPIAKPNTSFLGLLGGPCTSTTLRLPFDFAQGKRSGQALSDRVAEGFLDLNPTYDTIIFIIKEIL